MQNQAPTHNGITSSNATNSPNSSNKNTRVIVGMSGGVDSSVSAYLLQKAGYQVEGLFMKNWDEDDGTEYCTAVSDLADAQSVCDKLGIKLHTANFAAEYWDGVFEHFLVEYRSGRTPNPDILCNKEIKFKAFLDYACTLGADFIATGHYVRRKDVRRKDVRNKEMAEDDQEEQTFLMKGLDTNKDQSYFLHAVDQSKLSKTLFPVGELDKPEVRRIAEEIGLITHDKKDSTGICFIGERKFSDFLKQYIPAQPGNIESDKGDIIGKHHGLMYHTIGQRQGLGIGGLKNYDESPWYVAHKDLDRNVLVAVQGAQHPMLFANELTTSKPDWINGEPFSFPFRCRAKVRYRQSDQDCTVSLVDNTENQTCLKVVFDDPQRAVTPGQSVVFYLDDRCLGGVIIETTNAPTSN